MMMMMTTMMMMKKKKRKMVHHHRTNQQYIERVGNNSGVGKLYDPLLTIRKKMMMTPIPMMKKKMIIIMLQVHKTKFNNIQPLVVDPGNNLVVVNI